MEREHIQNAIDIIKDKPNYCLKITVNLTQGILKGRFKYNEIELNDTHVIINNEQLWTFDQVKECLPSIYFDPHRKPGTK